jgi:hypothetical protein
MTYFTSADDTPTTPWTAAAYAPMVTGSGAEKLASSGVAPLVAAARGYETVDQPQVADFAKHHNLGPSNSKRHSQVMQAARRADVLVLHWYRADDVANSRNEGKYPSSTAIQMRPSAPREDPLTGKKVKYENLTGSESVIDTNPGTPADWFSASPRLLITEGVLKGDSALTAMLRANGVTDEELRLTATTTRASAIDALGRLMDRIPPMNRVTILSFVGVGNWRGNDVWVSLKLAGREMLLAFDGDIDSNWNVWSQANSLWAFAKGRQAIVKLVDLSITMDDELRDMATGSHTSSEKVGIDDYLTRYGTWSDILTRLRPVLPEAPERSRDDVPVGTWKVSDDNNSVQEYAEGPAGADGRPGRPSWQPRVRIGGRVTTIETHRAPTQREIASARIGEGLEDEDVAVRSTCRIELQWVREDGLQERAVVTGPAVILMYPPAEWDKRRAEIPNNLLLHAEWPPKKGQEWLSAIKDNNAIPTAQNVSWTTMGWVPVEDSSICTFISGRTIISPSAADAAHTVAGVNDGVLPGSSKFNLPLPEMTGSAIGEVMGESWVAKVRKDLKSLREHYLDDSPWTNADIAAVTIAAGLRPVVPTQSTTVIYVQGPPGQGKSWTVSQMLSFHQREKTWTNQQLPGSMKDTFASVEQAVSQANIWVMDDLAPSADKRQSDMEQARVGDLIRSVHNGSSKRRSGPDLKAAVVFDPKALLIVTAENEHGVNSVRDRTVILNLDRSSLKTPLVQKLEDFRDSSGVPGRLTVAAVQLFQYYAQMNTWETMIDGVTAQRKAYKEIAAAMMSSVKVEGKADTRHIGMAVDLMMGLAALEALAGEVEDNEMMAYFDTSNKDNLPVRVARVVSASLKSQGEVTPGRSVLEAVRNLITSGVAHILNASDPTSPPLFGADANMNRSLGWQTDSQDKLRPLGVAIGYITSASAKGEPDVIMLHQTIAFDTAQRRYPHLLPPGTSATTSFGSVWNEGLAHPAYVRKDGRATRVFKINGHSQRGVPIHLDQIIGLRESFADRVNDTEDIFVDDEDGADDGE